MRLTLTEVNRENFQTICSLTTNENGQVTDEEPFVDSNKSMLARAKAEGGWHTKAIVVDDTIVGLAMYGYDAYYRHYELAHFMIDYRYQGRGYGREALTQIIEAMENDIPTSDIYLAIHRDNHNAQRMYHQVGFIDTKVNINAYEHLMVKTTKAYMPPLGSFTPIAAKRG